MSEAKSGKIRRTVGLSKSRSQADVFTEMSLRPGFRFAHPGYLPNLTLTVALKFGRSSNGALSPDALAPFAPS
jgi:hypothetical protein